MGDGWQTGLWLAVIVSGLYHGLSPGMGWPLAVAAGLSEKRGSAVFAALVPLAAGHFAAMAVVLLPFALLAVLSDHSGAIRVGAGVLVVGFGLYRLIDRRHPRALARIRPTQLALWSFAVAIAHGAGFLLIPIYLGLDTTAAHAMHHQPAGNSFFGTNSVPNCSFSRRPGGDCCSSRGCVRECSTIGAIISTASSGPRTSRCRNSPTERAKHFNRPLRRAIVV